MQLPLWAYLLVSAAAIAAIALMVRWLQPGAVPVLTVGEALRRFREDFPNLDGASAVQTPDGRTFLLLAASGAVVGCLTLIGLRWTARRIEAHDIAEARIDGTRTILAFDDVTWPTLAIDWRDPVAARDWRDRFDAVRRPNHA